MDVAEVVALGIGAQHIELLAGEPQRPATELEGQGQIATDRQARSSQLLDRWMHDHPGSAAGDASPASQPQAVDVGEQRGSDFQNAPAAGLQAIAPRRGSAARHRRDAATNVVSAGDRLPDSHGRGWQARPVRHLQLHVQRI